MMTAGQIMNYIHEIYEELLKEKDELWEDGTSLKDFMATQKLHMTLGQIALCETLFGIVEEETKNGQDK